MTIENPLTPAESVELVVLKARMEADEERFKELTGKLKAEQKTDGIVDAGVPSLDGGTFAFVLYSQHRINDAKFNAKYPQNKHADMYKVAPDTTKIRKALNEKQIIAVSTPVRALRITTLAEAEEAEKKFSQK